MALPPASPNRQLKHQRCFDVQVFARGDGLWEVDARLTDVKTRDLATAGGVRPAGVPLHEMLLRLVVDTELTIHESGAETYWMPYPGQCNDHGDAYGRLVGLNLLRGFRAALKERLGGVLGCTHITELAQVLPTAVIQAFAGEVIDTREGGQDGTPPFQIDRCHALRRDGEAVRQFYPRWYRPSQGRPAHNAAPAADPFSPDPRPAR
ncbi:DUF2889 domain-containing protein [Caldimonas sp. KR1-144]|uniref:DUF2889 domain-containing protein n=1 Tax=Caldimonas sp. KR1-144 TaxID=3400911 RepID=UPI003C0699B8